MTWDETAVRAAARRAYEQGRWRRASRILWLVAPLIGLGMILSGAPWTTLALGGLLLVATTLARWRGGLLGSAATTGLLAGLPAYGLPLFGMWGTGSCSGACCSDLCLTLCVAGGLLTGVLVGAHAATRTDDRFVHVAVAVGISALTAALGCASYGLAATGAMAATALLLAGGVTLLAPVRSAV